MSSQYLFLIVLVFRPCLLNTDSRARIQIMPLEFWSRPMRLTLFMGSCALVVASALSVASASLALNASEFPETHVMIGLGAAVISSFGFLCTTYAAGTSAFGLPSDGLIGGFSQHRLLP